MSLVDDRRDTHESAAQNDFGRQPPSDMTAEQSVLGGMLLSKDAIADVIEQLRPDDFYRPAHQTVCEAILDLYARGEPADPVTVSAVLDRNGELKRVGGAPYLVTLTQIVPTAANAGYYAKIVAEKAILRRLVAAGTRIVQYGYAGADGQDVAEVVDRAQAEVYDVTDKRTAEDYQPLESLLQPAIDELDAIATRGGISRGVPTGFAELDDVTCGLHPGQMITVAARPGVGKALALGTPLPTPSGWTTMGDLQIGDQLFGADGRPTQVVAATEVMVGRPCYEVKFSDGTVIVADAEHQWRTTTRAARRAQRIDRWAIAEQARKDVHNLSSTAKTEPDNLVTVHQLIGELGAQFKAVIQAEAEAIGSAAKISTEAAGAKRQYLWHAPAYSRRALLEQVALRVSRPINSWHRLSHNAIVTTRQLADSVRCETADSRRNHAVDCTEPLQLPEADLPIPPYTLGAWLGDGMSSSARITSADPEIVDLIRQEGVVATPGRTPLNYTLGLPKLEIPARNCDVCGAEFNPSQQQVRTCGKSCGGRVRSISTPVPHPRCPDCNAHVFGWGLCGVCKAKSGTVQALLRTLGVLQNKHIPLAYLRASERQRRALLAGLLDTDGTVNESGRVAFAVTNKRLADDFMELALGLGYRATMTTKTVEGRNADTSTCYTIGFTPADQVFGLTRKAARTRATTRPGTKSRYIVDVREVPSVPVRCVQVDNDDHMYLAGRSMVPTHNSTLGLDVMRSCSIKHGLGSVIFSLEMSRTEIVMRLLSAEAKVKLADMRSGRMSDNDWTRMARRMSEINDAPLFVDDSPNLTMMEIRAKARRLKQRHDIRLIVVDYLQLMTSGKRVESRQQEVSEFSRQLKLLAKELDVAVIAISQLNRGPEQRADKKPILSDLRESGAIEQDSDVVILINRPDAFDRDDPRGGEADLILAKHRNGPTATITVAHQLHMSRFVDMARG
jgi:replicative DNA helicase